MHYLSPLAQQAVEDWACPVCGRERGLSCQQPGGRPRTPHARRLSLAFLAARERERLRQWNESCTSPRPVR